MRRLLWRSAVVVLASMMSFPVAPASADTAAPPEILLENQPFTLTGTVRANFVFRLPDGVNPTRNALLDIEVHRRIANRSSFRSIASRQAEAAVIDSVSVRLSRAARRADGSYVVTVTVTSTTDSVTGLRIPFDGVYPVSLTLRPAPGAAPSAQVLTFVHRSDKEQPRVRVGAAVRLVSEPSLQPDGTVEVSDKSRANVEQFLRFVTNQSAPLTLSVEPELLQSLSQSGDPRDAPLLARLVDALRTRSVSVSAFTTLDPSLFAAVGQSDEFIEQVRFGETVLNRLLPGVSLQRGTWWATHALSRDGVSLLRKAGIVSVILSPAAQRGTESAGSANILRRPDIATAELMSVRTIEAGVSETLTSGTASLAAYRAVAELIVERDDLLAGGTRPDDIRLMISTPSGRLDNRGALERSVGLLRSFALVDMSIPPTVNGSAPVVRFPETTRHGGESRAAGISVAQQELLATQSMTADTDPRRELWMSMLAMGESSGVTEPNEYVAGLRSQLAATRAAVSVTTPNSITLSGRQGAIRIQLRNDSDQPLTVRVRMASAKLQLTQPVRLVTLAAGSTTEVEVAAGTRTNGRFPISVRVTTPAGDTEVVPYITITASVNAIAGLGQLVGISLLLMILAWWWSHWRRARLKAAEATTVADQ